MFPAASGVWTFGPRKVAQFEGGCQAACDGASVEEVDLEGCRTPLPLYTLLSGCGCNVTSQPLAPGDLLFPACLPPLFCHGPITRDYVPWEL